MKTKRFVGASPTKSSQLGSSSPPPRPAPSSAPPRSKIPGRRRPPSPLPPRRAAVSSYVPPLQTIGHKEKTSLRLKESKLEVSDEEARIRRSQFRRFFKRKGMTYLFTQQGNFDQLLKLGSEAHDTLLAELHSSEIVYAKKDDKGLEVVALDGQGRKFKVSIVISCGRICLSGEEWLEFVASNNCG